MIPRPRHETVIETGHALRVVYDSEPTFGRCRNRILDTLLSNGIEVKGGTKEFQEHVSDMYESFLVDAFDQMVCFGMVTWAVTNAKPRKGEGRVRVPVIVPHALRTVRVFVRPDYALEWGCEPFEQRRQAHVWPVPGEHPDPVTGAFRSRVARTVAQSAWMDQMFRLALAAEVSNTMPFVPLQMRAEKTPFYEKGVNYDIKQVMSTFTDPSAVEQRKSHFDGAVTDAMLQRPADFKIPGPYIRGVEADEHTFAYQHIFRVPELYEVAKGMPQAQPRSDLMDLERDRQEAISGIMGLPAAMVVAGRKKGLMASSAVDDNELAMFRDTLHHYRSWMVMLLEEVHNTIYGPEPDLKYHIPFAPIVSSAEELQQMFATGVISAATLQKAWLVRVGLDPAFEPAPVSGIKSLEVRELDIKNKAADKKPAGPR